MNIIQKNRTKTDCGVVAIYNAAIISGLRKRYSTIEKVAKSHGYDPKVGIYPSTLSATLDTLGVCRSFVYPKSAEYMERRLAKGSAYVIAYNPQDDRTGHVITVIMDTDGDVRIINPGRRDAKTWAAFKKNIAESGMKEFYVYEITTRHLARRHVKSRAT